MQASEGTASPGAPSTGPSAGVGRYVLAAVVTVAAVLSQYVVPQTLPVARPLYESLVGGLFIVYGLPIVAFALLVGGGPLRQFSRRMGRATREGLRWYGLLSLLGLFVSFVLVILYTALDPSALDFLQKPNPVLEEAQGNPWFYVGLSFVVGACEEVIFRGWLFGFWRDRPGVSWVVHATWTSVVFAGVHVYYAQTYGPASPFVYPTLFLLGFAFAATYHASGGNLVVVILLHGVNDAAGFLSILSPSGSLALHYGIVLVGVVIGLLQAFGIGPGAAARRAPALPPPPPPPWGWSPAPWTAPPPVPPGPPPPPGPPGA